MRSAVVVYIREGCYICLQQMKANDKQTETHQTKPFRELAENYPYNHRNRKGIWHF